MSLSASGRTWDEATSPAAVRLVRRYESEWRVADNAGRRPDPDTFLSDVADCPGARLALLRADLSLRWEAGEKVGAAWYRDHYLLSDETLVALVYEEFCLREDDGEEPEPSSYYEQYPEVESRLRRVLDIHDLVGSGTTASLGLAASPTGPAFPEAGQTIAGFRLVEELGRGAFARVFRAEERQLADRPVALKVARTGSREPQTLARLQHTHIVPVHSTRTDPATGLHLLCMPYFGRVTLARILSDPKARTARTGAELLDVLDRLGEPDPRQDGRSAGRGAILTRSHAQAIAWWGARMAEALEHAHDRGVLHRDIKPSNVLVTADAMPMLLDFNLAREAVLDDSDSAPAALGGTLDYMAPEHLEELADGVAGRVDRRSDLYSLGVLLFEALTGERPFALPRTGASVADSLLRAAAKRRAEVPSIRAEHPEISPALEVVVRRCLAPSPEDRYAAAAELAIDLQAVADDQPLRFAREPLAGRALGWFRRRRRVLATAVPVVAALVVITACLVGAQINRARIRNAAVDFIKLGENSRRDQKFAEAMNWFDSAARLCDERPYLVDLYTKAREQYNLAKLTGEKRDDADALFRDAESLRFRLIGFGGDLARAEADLLELLHRFYVLEDDDYTRRAEAVLLDDARRERLFEEVNELLFMLAIALDKTGQRANMKRGLVICEKALVFATPNGPWRALRARIASRLDALDVGRTPAIVEAPAHTAGETSALASFQWGMLCYLAKQRDQAIAWLRQAEWLEPGNYWYQYDLGFLNDIQGTSPKEAMEHYTAALALRPHSPWVRFSRARLNRQRGDWQRAADDFARALSDFRRLPESARHVDFERQTRLELGLIHQSLGNPTAARTDYEAVIASGPGDSFGRAARTNLARIDAESGAVERARAAYDALIAESPSDRQPRIGRAMLALRLGEASSAEADLTDLIQRQDRPDADALAHRATARLLMGRAEDAEGDAREALRLRPTPARERLWARTLLAVGRTDGLAIDRPDEFARLPLGGPSLAAGLRRAADRLRVATVHPDSETLHALLTRAILLGALGDADAEREASRAVALAPFSPEGYLVRARIRRRRGALRAATADVNDALALAPNDPRLLELRGTLKAESGDPRAGLDDLRHAGALDTAHAPSAEALLALGFGELSVREWSLALDRDPEDPWAYLGRARGWIQLGRWDQALADLEQATGYSDGRSSLNLRIAAAYVRCIPQRPTAFPRALSLVFRSWMAWRGGY